MQSRELVKLYYRIGEVSEIVGVQPHVLRYWETEFRSIRPQKSSKGQRVYSRRDVEKLLRVKDLLRNQGFTIAGARKRLSDPADAAPAPSAPVAAPVPAALTLPPGTLSPGALSPGALSPGALSPGTLSPGALSPGTLSGSTVPAAAPPATTSLTVTIAPLTAVPSTPQVAPVSPVSAAPPLSMVHSTGTMVSLVDSGASAVARAAAAGDEAPVARLPAGATDHRAKDMRKALLGLRQDLLQMLAEINATRTQQSRGH